MYEHGEGSSRPSIATAGTDDASLDLVFHKTGLLVRA